MKCRTVGLLYKVGPQRTINEARTARIHVGASLWRACDSAEKAERTMRGKLVFPGAAWDPSQQDSKKGVM